MNGEGRPAGAGPVLLANLLNDVETLGPLLVDRIAAGDVLNAFLLAAGMQQIAEDHVHRDRFLLDRAARRLGRRLPAPWGRLASGMARAAGGVVWQGTVRSAGRSAAGDWAASVDGVSQRLAALVGSRSAGVRDDLPRLEAEARALAARVGALPGSLRREVVRLPSSFRNLDQAPEDLDALAEAFARGWPDRGRWLLVVGIRSSGGYLAPLLAASLRRHGYRAVEATTLRPGQRWLPPEARRVRRLVRGGGMALVVDDPPRTWNSVRRAVRDLQRRGLRGDRVVAVLATLPGAAEPPERVPAYEAVTLPFSEWAIRRRLEPDQVRESLARLLAPRETEVAGVRPLPRPGREGARGHAQAVYEVRLRSGGRTRSRLVRARGVGLGYFGQHALAVAGALGDQVTAVHGLDRGVLYEDWPAPGSRLHEPLSEPEAEMVAEYVARRARALALPWDPARRLHHQGEAWQWAGHALAGMFGRASELGRPLGMALARRLLAPGQPAVIDNRTEIHRFAAGPDGRGLVKCDFDTGVFTNDDFFSFDPVSDVAMAAVGTRDAASADRLRRAYEAASGSPVEPERWLLDQLVHVLVEQETQAAAVRHTDLRPSRLVLRYYREVLLADVEPPPAGPVCAIDVDGVLETMPLGFPATSPAGALALRTLTRHGLRPVLATGRSLGEVRDRCAAYGLAGGVAEYGAAVYVHGVDRVRELLGPDEREALGRLRAALAGSAGVHLDSAFERSVRAFRIDARGRRIGLTADCVSRALTASGTRGRLRPVQGDYQTDFVPLGLDKSAGLRVLASELGGRGGAPVALAVGDTAEDLEMLRMAALGVAPGNAQRELRRAPGVTTVRRQAQAGLAEAVARVLGHRPGGCPVCAATPAPRSGRLLLDLLALQEVGRCRQVLRSVRLLAASQAAG